MSESRELDATIAEQVMGAKWVRFNGGEQLTMPWGSAVVTRYDSGTLSYGFCPRYSSDIAAAMEVVEQMRAKGWDWRLSSINEISWTRQWVAALSRSDALTYHEVAQAVAAALPLAVCECALKAIASHRAVESPSSAPLSGDAT